jgi:hypothetical protein
VDVPPLTPMDVAALRNAAALDWSAIDPSILGTLFVRGLDPKKRSQLGAHFTDPATIMRLVEPVVQRPLKAEWEQVKLSIAAHMANTNARAMPSTARPTPRSSAFWKGCARFACSTRPAAAATSCTWR